MRVDITEEMRFQGPWCRAYGQWICLNCVFRLTTGWFPKCSIHSQCLWAEETLGPQSNQREGEDVAVTAVGSSLSLSSWPDPRSTLFFKKCVIRKVLLSVSIITVIGNLSVVSMSLLRGIYMATTNWWNLTNVCLGGYFQTFKCLLTCIWYQTSIWDTPLGENIAKGILQSGQSEVRKDHLGTQLYSQLKYWLKRIRCML